MIRYPQRIARSEQTKRRAQSRAQQGVQAVLVLGVVLNTFRTESCFHPNPLPSVTPFLCRRRWEVGSPRQHLSQIPTHPSCVRWAMGSLFHLV